MMIDIHRRQSLLALAVLGYVAPFIVGCGPDAEIRTYPVAKEPAEQPAVTPVAAEAAAEPTDRMIGAILPAGERAWFFKATGPIEAMQQHAKAIEEFFRSVRVEPGAKKPEWKLPEGWKEQAGSGMRAATILIPQDDEPIELTVIALPSTGQAGEVLSNVNRWRSQMGLSPVDERGLAKLVREEKVGDQTMTVVDLRGRFSSGMAAPFAGRGGPISGGAAAGGAGQGDEQARGQLPPGHPPVNPHGSSAPSSLKFDAPKSWPASKSDGLRKAMFDLREGEQQARVTVIDFPASGGVKIADPLANMNRWRRDVGLGELKQEQLADAVEKIEVDGRTGHYAEMIPQGAEADDKEGPATVAAMVPAGDVIWFFKLTGNRQLVVRERDNFKDFLQSVRLGPADGADDGNQ